MTDLRLALRLCFRHPLLSLAAIGSLALGIGANTAIFTVLNGSVLKPLAYADPARLMVVWETRSDTPKRSVAPANFLDWRRETTAFSALAAFDDFTATLTTSGEAQRIHAVSASANFFEVLGVQADPQQPISRVRSIEEILSASMAARRFNTWIVGLFAATALLLAAIGTYGVMAFAVASRTRELGVRAALGAQPSDLIRMVMGQGLLLTIIASAIGLGASLMMTRFMASMLFDVAPRDPLTFGLVALALSSVAIAATLIPARRAMRINPMVALRD